MGQSVSSDPSSTSRRSQPPPPSAAPPSSTPATTEKDKDTTELMRVFRSFDADGDGRVSAAEIQKIRGCTAAEAAEMVAVVDSDGDGFISFEEFGALMEGEGGELSDALLRMAFAEFDENGDGFITPEELLRALGRVLCEDGLTVEKCSEMVAGVDQDGDGLISFDEFKTMMASKSF